MSRGEGASRDSAIGLRVIHALVFVGFGAFGLVAAREELSHLVASQRQPLHHGDPPSALALLGVVAILVGLGLIVAAIPRDRSAPLWASLAVLGGFALTVVALQKTPEGRNAPAANLAILNAAKAVHRQFVAELQQGGEVPIAIGRWEAAFAAELPVVRTRSYSHVPYKVQRVDAPGAIPEDLTPGTVLLYVSPDGARFELVPVGFGEEGEAWVLENREGETVRFVGVHNPGLGTPTIPSPPNLRMR